MKTAVDAPGRAIGGKHAMHPGKKHAYLKHAASQLKSPSEAHSGRVPSAVQTNTTACHTAFDAIGASALRIGTGLPSFLQRRIDFVEDRAASGSPDGESMYNLRPTPEREAHADAARPEEADGLADVPLSWVAVAPAGPGLANLGNTCFLNSVLQCLAYTPPLANYLLGGAHGRTCAFATGALPSDGGASFCVLCALERHVRRCLGPGRAVGMRSISPTEIVGHLRLIARHMRVGRQEDAHEFLRYVIDAMQRSGDGKRVSSGRSTGAKLVEHVFGGELCSEVHCLSCSKTSAKREPFLDISLDVRVGSSGDAPTVLAAFANYMRTERLSGSNRYRCESDGAQGCDALVDAEKRFRIERAPRVLTVHLKRFQVSVYGVASKISRDVDFGERLDIGQHCAPGVHASYRLYAVLVHEGQTCNSGHYHAFVRAPNDVWYSMNDSSVHQVSLATVLKQRAYLLFYVLDEGARGREAAAASPESSPTKVEERSPKRARASPEKASEPASASADERPIVAKTMWHRTAAADFKLAAFEAQAELSNARHRPRWHIRAVQ